MKSMQKGFTLIELMIVVAIIAILTAIALPAYQDYSVRAKTSEAVVAMDAAKLAVTETASSLGTAVTNITNNTIAGYKSQVSSYVASVTIGASGVITAVTQHTGGTAESTLTLTPAQADKGAPITWTCGISGSTLAKYVPASCRPVK